MAGLGILALNCTADTEETINDPFGSLIPQCAENTLAPARDFENQHAVSSGEFGLSYQLYERACKGPNTKLIMSLREFDTTADAANYLNNFLAGPLPTGYAAQSNPVISLSPQPDGFKVRRMQLNQRLTGEGRDGFDQTWLLFKQSRYVATYMSSVRGELLEVRGDFFVGADSRPEVLEMLAEATLGHWTLPN